MTEKDVKRLEAALEEEQEMADDPEALLDSIEVGWLEFLEVGATNLQAGRQSLLLQELSNMAATCELVV